MLNLKLLPNLFVHSLLIHGLNTLLTQGLIDYQATDAFYFVDMTPLNYMTVVFANKNKETKKNSWPQKSLNARGNQKKNAS